MARPEKHKPAIVSAAEGLEDELARLEAMSRAVCKIRLDSEKNLSRAARELNETVALPELLGERLRALTAAMQEMQVRQQAALEPLAVRAAEIQQRTARLGEHMQAFAALGKAAAEVTALLQAEDGKSPAALERVESGLTEIVEGSRALFDRARADDFPEVAREADALKQRIAALRGRLGRKT